MIHARIALRFNPIFLEERLAFCKIRKGIQMTFIPILFSMGLRIMAIMIP